MKKYFFIPALIFTIFFAQGCDDNDDLSTPDGNKNVENIFKERYPNATHTEWEKKGEYWVADFWQDGKEVEAWFTVSGTWHQAETDITYAALPEAVKTAFQTGDYKDWRVEDVDMIERNNEETFYLLDVERGNQDYDLSYAPDGTLISATPDRS